MDPHFAVVAKKRVPSGPPVFTYYSTYFNGIDDARRGAGLTGAADSKLGLISFWIKMASTSNDAVDYPIFVNNTSSFQIYRKTSGEIRVLTRNAASSLAVWIDSVGQATMLKADGWAHWICSWDTSVAGRGKLYKNGSDVTNLDTFTVDAIVDYTVTEWVFGVGGSSGFPDWLISEFYMTAPSTYFDLTNSTNRDKFFIDPGSGGEPVDLGANGDVPTGTSPLVYMHNRIGGSPSWFTNQGTGGNFTQAFGTITDGGSDKP